MSADASADPIAEAPSVSALLKRSRAHHANKTRYANQKRGSQHVPNYPQAEAEIRDALRLRLEAHELDPTHSDPEWANDTVPHDALIAFMRRYSEIA